jgi:hypothetical protein
MSINKIKRIDRIKVLMRLLKSNESFEVACSKAGLNDLEARQFLLK